MKKVLTVKDIMQVLGICEKTAYNLIKKSLETDNMFRVIRVGKLYKIPSKPFFDWLDGLEY